MQKKWIIGLGLFIVLAGIAFGQTFFKKADVKDPMLFLSLGDFLMKQGYSEQALSAYGKVLEIDPSNKAAMNNIGYYYKDINPLLAEDYFKKALDIDPEFETAMNNLALLYNKNGEYGKAIPYLRGLISIRPDYLQYNYDLAINLAQDYYHSTRDYIELSEAIKYFKVVYEKDPDFEHSLENIKVLEEIKRAIEKR